MKNKFLKILSKPKIIIPLVAFIGIIGIIFGYNNIGKAPVVDFDAQIETAPVFVSGNVIDLSFPKNGRIAEVLVKENQFVRKGEILAKLSAPDAEGTINQTKGALDLAEAEYALLNTQYASAKEQQDLIVQNAYRTLLSSGLEGVPDKQTTNSITISGTYTCDEEGYYEINPYRSGDNDSGFSFEYSGLENGTASVKYENSIPLGQCGLQVKFTNSSYFSSNTKWKINIPNTESSVYLSNKNAYELALKNREKTLSDLLTTIGNGEETSVAKATVDAARGAYEAALGVYQNNLIIAPVDGMISFVDKDLKVGQSVALNKTIISITIK